MVVLLGLGWTGCRHVSGRLSTSRGCGGQHTHQVTAPEARCTQIFCPRSACRTCRTYTEGSCSDRPLYSAVQVWSTRQIDQHPIPCMILLHADRLFPLASGADQGLLHGKGGGRKSLSGRRKRREPGDGGHSTGRREEGSGLAIEGTPDRVNERRVLLDSCPVPVPFLVPPGLGATGNGHQIDARGVKQRQWHKGHRAKGYRGPQKSHPGGDNY